MDKNTLAGFRQLLEARLKGLLDEGRGPVLKPADSGLGDPMDSADLASHHCDQELVNTICYRNQKLLREIQSAIKRIDNGEFGACWLCSSSIGMQRLHAHPTATLCIRCQGTLEALRRRLPAA
jgi:DnaK suppressor protein